MTLFGGGQHATQREVLRGADRMERHHHRRRMRAIGGGCEPHTYLAIKRAHMAGRSSVRGRLRLIDVQTLLGRILRARGIMRR